MDWLEGKKMQENTRIDGKIDKVSDGDFPCNESIETYGAFLK